MKPLSFAGLPRSAEAIRRQAAVFPDELLDELAVLDQAFLVYPRDFANLLFR
jgi:hypothetical protein